ncbi:MAG: HAD family hydrolase [Algoriphagus sp.]|nr:HAD family hydrolase [Algoriphagus sp.]
MKKLFTILFILLFVFGCNEKPAETNSLDNPEIQDPLPSWNEGKSKQAILDFVTKTTKEGSPDFIPEADRIACFDNDGTLWGEQPMVFQLSFAMDYIKKEASTHPEWQTKEPFKSALAGDMKAVMAEGEQGLLKLVMASHTGMTTEQFDQSVRDWVANSRHPVSQKPYTQMIYTPMLELLNYLRANGYKTFIVSGGGIDFMRVWAEEVYGISPYQIIGSSVKVKYEVSEDGTPSLVKLPELNFNDDKEGKPVAIHQHIGKRPVFTAGNSDGDYAMLEWTSTGKGYPRFGMIVHHTDSVREVAYDRNSPIGHLEKGLDDASKYNWLIVDMKTEWKKIYPFDN